MKKYIWMFAIIGTLSLTTPVFAHVTITDKQLTQGYKVITLRVPTEKPIATTGLRVVIPDGVIVHGVKPLAGWTHRDVKVTATPVATMATSDDDHGDKSVIKEVIWSGGVIGAGEYMEFSLSTQYTGDPKTLVFKTYQTYADGSVVPWDSTDEKHPAPQVEIVKDLPIDVLSTKVETLEKKIPKQSGSLFSVVALALSIGAIAMVSKKK